MPGLPYCRSGFHLREVLHESARTLVARADREVDGARVILKTLATAIPSPLALARLRQEAKILQALAGNGSVLLIDEFVHTLVLSDSGGCSLARHLSGRALDPGEFFPLALRLGEALAKVHRQGYFHRNLNPSNVVLSSTKLELIDFGLATNLVEQNPVGELIGTLAYLSPEQTGRLRRSVDQRSDLYSLGATFYELLTGAPPFVSEDPLEVVHSHLALQPTPPERLKSVIPPGLSDLVLKLLAKSPEERYQSLDGLLADLKSCADTFAGVGYVSRFSLATADTPPSLAFPDQLYGRERELHTLYQALDQARRGKTVVCLLHGPEGTGKSSLVQEFGMRFGRQGGTFLKGKADPLRHGVHYTPLHEALGEHAEQVLTRPPEQVRHWRETMFGTLGELVGVLLQLVPSMERLLGSQPQPVELEPTLAANRNERALALALQSLSQSEEAVVLCLDDLHWADLGTLRLLERLAAEPATPLLLLAVWRSNEVDETHRLGVTLQRLRTFSDSTLELPLQNLTVESVGELLQDTLGCSSEEVLQLAVLVERKTRGNPFFLRQFLNALRHQRQLEFLPEKRCWRWSLEELAQAQVTSNVAALLESRLQHLPSLTLEALQAGACNGGRFDLSLAAAGLGRSPQAMLGALQPALEEGLVVAGGDLPNVQLRFLHDRVHQAVLESLTPDHRAALHLSMGREMRVRAQARESDAAVLLEIVGHFNQAHSLLVDPEKLEVAWLNLRAGQQALGGGSFDTALTCILAGIGLVDAAQAWSGHYPLLLELHLLGGEAAHLLGLRSQAEALLEQAMEHSRTEADRARALEVRLRDLMRTAIYAEALNVSLQALELLGERFPRQPAPLATGLRALAVLLSVHARGLDRLVSLPRSGEAGQQLTMRLLGQAVICAAFAEGKLVGRLVFRMVERSIRYGLTPESSVGFAQLAVVCIRLFGPGAHAQRLGDLALELARRDEAGPQRVRTGFFVHHMIRHWTQPLSEVADVTPALYKDSLNLGDHAFAQILATAWCRSSFQMGLDLPTLRERLDALETSIRTLARESVHPQLKVQNKLLDLLTTMPREGQNGFEFGLDQVVAGENSVACWMAASGEALLHLLFRQPVQASLRIERLEAWLADVPGSPEIPLYHFLASMVWLAVLPQVGPVQARVLRRKLKSSRRLLLAWRAQCPESRNFRLLMIEAETARIRGQHLVAAQAYDQASVEARQNGFSLEEALAIERAGLLYLEMGRLRLARHYLQDACQAWSRYGAGAKVGHLMNCHNDLLRPMPTDFSAAKGGASLDLAWVIKAAGVLSREIEWERLLQSLLWLTMENAGARRGVLLLEQDGVLRVEAEAQVDRPGQIRMLSIPLAEAGSLAASVLHYCIRTGETLVIPEATRHATCRHDPYVVETRQRSIMVVPIRLGGRLAGLLYLENSLLSGAFTHQHAEVLSLLSAQMAISIENARQFLQIRAQHDQILVERDGHHLEQMRSAALEVRKNSLAAFLGIASHDIKDSLASILMWARQLGSGRLEPAQAQEQIEGVCRRATSLVHTYLDSVAVETGRALSLYRRAVDLASLVEDEIDFLLSRLLPEERVLVALEWELESVTLHLDQERMQQVVGNLIGNALRYCALGTSITVTLESSHGGARLIVEDQGPGISETVRERLFRPFERGSDEVSSTGLGLWIARLIVEAHGGRIHLAKTSVGSRFEVSLPPD